MNTILTEKEEDFAEKRNRRKTRTGRALGWILLAAAVVIHYSRGLYHVCGFRGLVRR